MTCKKWRAGLKWVLGWMFIGWLLLPAGPAFSQPIPELDAWKSHIYEFGGRSAQIIQDPSRSYDERLISTYYDYGWASFQAYDYTGDPTFLEYARTGVRFYRDEYVLKNEGKVPGYWLFPHGLAEDYLRYRDTRSHDALLLMSQNGAYAGDWVPLDWTRSADFSREVAYVIQTYLQAERIGAPRRARLAALVDQAFSHIDQWFVYKNAKYVRPFMVALTADALIEAHQVKPDPRTVPALTRAADAMWETMWLPQSQSFMYTDRVAADGSGGTEPAPDLNLLCARLYSFLYRETGQPRFLERGDAIFAGGVRFAYLSGGKQYNQSYRLSFKYVRDRSNQAPAVVSLSPGSVSSRPEEFRLFTATYADPDGNQDITGCYVMVGTGSDTALWGYYNAASNRLYLLSDDHSQWLGGFAPGSAGVIRTGQGALDCSRTTVTRSGKTVAVSWSLSAPAKWVNTTQNVYLYVEDRVLHEGWKKMGYWTIL